MNIECLLGHLVELRTNMSATTTVNQKGELSAAEFDRKYESYYDAFKGIDRQAGTAWFKVGGVVYFWRRYPDQSWSKYHEKLIN